MGEVPTLNNEVSSPLQAYYMLGFLQTLVVVDGGGLESES